MKKKPSMVVQIDNLKRKHSESVWQGPPVGSMNKNVKIGDEKETEYKKQAEKEKKIIQNLRREKESPASHQD